MTAHAHPSAAKKADYPALSPAQLTKLKHLSLVSLAMQSRILPYAQLLQYLDLSSIRELEDTIIDAIYQNVVRGKLDQKEQRFEVEYTMGRDVPPEQMGNLLESLQLWYASPVMEERSHR
jgi:COP9 signalosome complex subunit 7